MENKWKSKEQRYLEFMMATEVAMEVKALSGYTRPP